MKILLQNTHPLFNRMLIYAISLLLLRIIITGEFYFIFLIWNLFLAAVPLWVSRISEKYSSNNKYGAVLLFFVWLLFLPNTFYVITDLIHLKNSSSVYLMLDVLLIFSFAVLCCNLGFYSLNQINNIFRINFPKLNLNFFNYFVLILCSFGIYLGRFLRYNSWNIISNPKNLFFDCLNYFIYPVENIEVWIFTFGFGLFLISIKSLFEKTSYAINQK